MTEAGDAFERALAFVQANRVLRPRERVLLASGGGAASVGMLSFVALARGRLALRDVAVVTVDDGTDDGSERCVEAARIARQLGFSVYVVDMDRSSSVLARARELRQQGSWDALAVGDTLEDSAARTLRELMNERAVRGLCARRRDGVRRPLLGCTVRDADALSTLAGVALPSAPLATPRGARALDQAVREAILPRIRVVWPNADRSLATLAARTRAR